MLYSKPFTKRTALALGAALSLVAGTIGLPRAGSAQTASTWPTFHGGATRQGAAAVSGPRTNAIANRFTLSGNVEDSPVVGANGVAYIGDDTGTVYALDPKSGNGPAWTTPVSGKVIAVPTLSSDGSKLFVATDSGNVYALNAATGQKLWGPQSLGGPVLSSLLLSQDGSRLFVPVASTVFGLNTADGNQTLKIGVGQNIPSTAGLALSPDGGTLYIPASNDFLFATPATGGQAGQTFTTYYLDGNPESAPVVDQNGNIYITTTNGSLQGFSQGSSTARFTDAISPGVPPISTPAIANGVAVVGSENHNIYAVNTSTGQTAWSKPTGAQVVSSPAIATGNNMLYVGSNDGSLYAFDVNGTQVWTRAIGTVVTSPALAPDGSVWAASGDGVVARFHDLAPPTNLPSTITPGPSPIPTATAIRPTAVTTATATATPTSVTLSVALSRTQAKPNWTQVVTVHAAPNTAVHLTFQFPNGDKHTANVTTDATGAATYKYKQPASKLFHNRFTVNVVATAGAQSVTKTYKLLFGNIDVSAEPRSQKPGGKVQIYVHAKAGARVAATLLFPNGTIVHLPAQKAGRKGFGHWSYKVGKNLTRGSNHKVTVRGSTLNGHPNYFSTTSFTIK